MMAAVLATLPSGCATSGMAASRSVIYDSVESLSADSSAVVVVEVQAVSDVDGKAPMSAADAVVTRAFDVPALGRDVGSVDTLTAGASVTVLQLGTRGMGDTPAPLLQAGETYLLFLTPSMLDGGKRSAFFVTGGTAGLYESSGGPDFGHVASDDPDRLPTSVSVVTERLVFNDKG